MECVLEVNSSQITEVNLGDIVDIYDGPHATPPKSTNGPVFLGISNLTNGRLDLSSTDHVDEENFSSWTRRVIPTPGDLVFSYETRLGEAALIPNGLRCCLGRRMGLLRSKSDGLVDNRYLLYAYLSPAFQNTLKDRTVPGSTVDRIPLNRMAQFPIKIHRRTEDQRQIASILGSLDEKIELNQQMNETLEAMARAIFRSWFIDFDPVRIKARGGDPTAELGLSPEIAALFPDSFQNSELGEIPEGWRVANLGQLANVVDCLHSKKPDRKSSGKLLLQLANIVNLGLTDVSDAYFIADDDYEKWTSRFLAVEGDCVITNVGRVGAVSQIPANVQAALGRNMTGIRCRLEFPYPSWLITALLSDHARSEISIRTDSGTILDALNVKNIPLLRFVVATEAVHVACEGILESLRKQMDANLGESRRLADTRDYLLPLLLSGKIDVSGGVEEPPFLDAGDDALLDTVLDRFGAARTLPEGPRSQ